MKKLLALSALLVSCAGIAAPPPGHPSPNQALEMMEPIKKIPAKDLPNKGKVVSAINANEYTYIEVSDGKANHWIAAPLMEIKVGNNIRYEEGSTMSNFYSKLLKRTFEQLMFVGQVAIVKP